MEHLEMSRKGGNTTLKKYGKEYFVELSRKARETQIAKIMEEGLNYDQAEKERKRRIGERLTESRKQSIDNRLNK